MSPRAVSRLHPVREAELQAAAYTYPQVGATVGELPVGYNHLRRRAVIGWGDADLAEAGDRVLRWGVHTGAGLRVAAAQPVAAPSVVVQCRLGVGPLAIRIPCRVVYAVDEPRRRGFAYGTLPGHPEVGEESFMVVRRDDGAVLLEVVAFANPAWLLARVFAPATRVAQELAVRRYLRALVPLGGS